MSVLRKLEWGKFDAQFADLTGLSIEGQSIIMDGAPSNMVTSTVYGPAQMDWRYAAPATGGKKDLFKHNLATLRAMLGMTPVLVRVRWWWWMVVASSYTRTLALRRLLPGRLPDWADVDYRYRDVSLSLAWGDDASAYSPVWDLDVLTAAFAACTVPIRASGPTNYSDYFDITTELAAALKSGGDLCFMLWKDNLAGAESSVTFPFYFATAGKRPYLEIMYLLPLEFFACKADGTIDMTQLLNNSLDTDTGNLYLGALERGQTSTPVASRVKNFSAMTLPLVEVLDDSPEWTPPVPDAGNAGSGDLDYVTLLDASVSQKYWVKFTSATDFEVKATKYKDYQTDIHASYGGTGWTGSTAGDFTAPSGGLTIPAAAWSGTPQANDVFTFYVTGQTTDAAWPADSNAQVEMTKDDAGDPDDTMWRPVKGQRTTTTDAVTIDATTKTIDVEHIDTAKWPASTKCFIADYTNIDEGYISSCTASSVTIVFPSATNHVYAAGVRLCTTLPLGSIAPAVFGLTTGEAGDSQSNPALIPMTGAQAKGFTGGATIVIQDPGDPDITEEATVLSVQTNSITCTAYLANDYATGALVMMGGSGEAKFWLRVVSDAGTAEELKRLRLVTRT